MLVIHKELLITVADQRETQTLLKEALQVLVDFYGRKSGNNQCRGHVECGKIYYIYLSPAELCLLHGPLCSVHDMGCILGQGTTQVALLCEQ